MPRCLPMLLLLASLARPGLADPAPYKDAPGPHAVASLLEDWQDSARDRSVPVKIYYPEKGTGPFPVVLFSHGLGGSRNGYSYLGEHWASHGYVSVHLQHVGSDGAVRSSFHARRRRANANWNSSKSS